MKKKQNRNDDERNRTIVVCCFRLLFLYNATWDRRGVIHTKPVKAKEERKRNNRKENESYIRERNPSGRRWTPA